MNLDLSRVQFASTSIYHFLFVPITIGLAFLVAILQTMWHRSGDPDQRRLTRFFGTLLLINVAIGVVTGIVQEFEFGMNWSAYSRFVGDVFGAPLAMEGLAAFFLESTFLGLWVFGWNQLPKRVHLACIWLVALGSVLSAAFIMAANSWMQHPVGYTINSKTGQPQLSNIVAVFTNPVFLWGYTHVLLASAVTGALVMLAVSAWHLRRGSAVPAFASTAKVSLVVLLPAVLLAMFVGSELGVVEAKYQPMKIAAAEAQWNTCQPCSFSLFQIGGGNDDETPTQILEIPHLLSLLATNHWNGQVQGLNQINAQYQQEFGPGDYVPNVFIQYWAMRVMAYIAGSNPSPGPLGGLGRVASSPGALPLVPFLRHLVCHCPLSDEYGWLVPDRKRSSALDCPGAPQNLGRGVARSERHLGLDHPHPVHRGLRGVRGHRRHPHAPLRAQEPGRGGRSRSGAVRRGRQLGARRRSCVDLLRRA